MSLYARVSGNFVAFGQKRTNCVKALICIGQLGRLKASGQRRCFGGGEFNFSTLEVMRKFFPPGNPLRLTSNHWLQQANGDNRKAHDD